MIRIPNIPGQPQPQLNEPGVNGRVLAAPSVALGNVAQAIGNVSEGFFKIAVDAQRQENARRISEKMMGMQQDFSQFQLDLQKDPDPASRITKTKNWLASYKGQMEDDVPEVRDNLVSHFDEFAGKAMIRQAEDSANLQLKRTGLQLSNQLDAAVTAGDAEGAHMAIDLAEKSGLILPEEATKKRKDVEFQLADNLTNKEIMADPKGWLDTNTPDKVPAGYTAVQWAQKRNYAEGALRDKTREAIGQIEDAIALGKITEPEQIDQHAGDLRPSTVAAMKESLAKRNAELLSDAEKARRATPEYLHETFGRVSSLLANYEPEAEGYDTKLVEMLSLARTLPAGPARDELERLIEAPRAGMKAEIKDYADAAQKQLDDAKDHGRFGKVPEAKPFSTARVIDNGLLRDPKKLAAAGFSPEQITEINAPKPATSKNGSPQPADDESRLDAVRRLWIQRKGQSTLAPFDAASFEAILNHERSLNYTDPADEQARSVAETAMLTKYGEAKRKLADFIKVNPKATPEQIDAKVLEISGEQIHRDIKQSILPVRPTRALSPETSMNGTRIKLSNYGYASDTTPDSNSAKGIGHRDNKLIAGKSAAVTKSLADRLGLEHGDAFQVATTKGDFTLYYHDTVPSTDKRTGPLPETIDVYRPQDGSNSWGGTVLSIKKI